MNSWSSPLGGSAKTATRVAMPLCTRSAASSAPAPPESSDTTMMSAGATGSLATSAHPAARRTGSRTEGTATMAAAANATTTRIGAHLGRRELMLGFIFKSYVGTWKRSGTFAPSLGSRGDGCCCALIGHERNRGSASSRRGALFTQGPRLRAGQPSISSSATRDIAPTREQARSGRPRRPATQASPWPRPCRPCGWRSPTRCRTRPAPAPAARRRSASASGRRWRTRGCG